MYMHNYKFINRLDILHSICGKIISSYMLFCQLLIINALYSPKALLYKVVCLNLTILMNNARITELVRTEQNK